MKNKKITKRIFTIIITFILLISMFVSVNASENIKFGDVNTAISTGSDVSVAVSPISRIVNLIIPILKYLTLISGLFLLVYGIKTIAKKKQKRGILFIIISLGLLYASVMLDAIHICNHNID